MTCATDWSPMSSSRDDLHPSDPPSTHDAYETGQTTLDLDGISDNDLDSLSFEGDVDTHGNSLQTFSGLSLVVAGLTYLTVEFGAQAGPALSSPDAVLPGLLGTSAILLGMAVLTLRSSSDTSPQRPAPPSTMDSESFSSPDSAGPSRLARSRTDRKLFGVCGGIAAYLNLDPTLVRVGTVLGSVAFGPLILVYLGLALAMPNEPAS